MYASWFVQCRHEGESGSGDTTQDANTPAGGQQQTEAQQDRTFTQADVDRLIADRLGRQKQQFAGYDDYKAKAAKYDEVQAANATELEKAQKAAADAAAERDRLSTDLRETRLRSAVITAAASAKAVDPDAVFTLLDRDGVEVAEDGTVTGAVEAVAKLLDAKPFLRTVTPDGKPTGGIDQGAKSAGADVDFRTASDAEVKAALRRMGVRA